MASFLAPAAVLYAGLVIWPLIQAFVFSMYNWRGLSKHRKFVGFENFSKLAHDDVFFRAAQNNLVLLAVGGLVIVVLAVAIAHGLQGKGAASHTLRSVVLFPQMISLVAVAILWYYILTPHGLLNAALRTKVNWLGNPSTAFPVVGVSFGWYAIGFYILLFAAGLKSLPADVIEASELDGAVGLKRFWDVTWPMLWSIKRIAIVHLMITVMNVFVLAYLLEPGGAPDRATEMMLPYLYERAFTDSQFGYATAIAVANFVIVMALAVIILLAMRRDPQEARR